MCSRDSHGPRDSSCDLVGPLVGPQGPCSHPGFPVILHLWEHSAPPPSGLVACVHWSRLFAEQPSEGFVGGFGEEENACGPLCTPFPATT